MKQILSLCTILMLTAGCQTNEKILKNYPVSTTHSGFITVAKKQIPLPQGEWEVFATHSYLSSQSTPMLAFAFGNRDRNASVMAVTFSTNSDHSLGFGWGSLRTCSRSDMLHLEEGEHIDGGDKSCWFVNHSRMTRTSKKKSLRNEVVSRAKELGIRLPVTSIYSGFRISDTHDILTIRVYFNPEADGFDPPKQSAWATNDWHKDRIYTDKKKVSYVEKIKEWAEAFFTKVKAGFKGKLAHARTASK